MTTEDRQDAPWSWSSPKGGEERTGPPRGGPQDHGPEWSSPGPPEPYSDQEWASRLHQAVETTLARRRARRATQDTFKARRDVGLQARHRAKLARADERLREATEQGIHDSWHEEEA